MEPDTELGRYRVAGKLGAGGMGEVYRAHDTSLRRDVAIKVLPAELAADPDRLARLEREAQVLAALDHPNVAGVYGLEESDGTRFVVMQLASGVTLDERLSQGALPVDEATDIALQIARGLEAAHEAGIVHRDLKPANIMLDDDGAVKLLDFGLAKPTGSADSVELTASPTMLDATGAGVILGTAPYMSPEQARGRRVDKRADIWAWGCVVYEALTGKRLFAGESISDVLAAVLREHIDFDALPAATPAELRHLVERALEREAVDRLRDIGEARIALEGDPQQPQPGPASAPRSPAALAATLIAGITLGAGAAWWARTPGPEPVLALDIAPADLQTGSLVSPQISPDGRNVVYRADDRLWVRGFGQPVARAVPDTDNPQLPFWAPDSREIAYYSGGSLWRYSLDDGTTIEMAPMPDPASGGGGVWDPAGRLLVAQGSTELFSIPARGGGMTALFEPDPALEEAHFHGATVLPDGTLVYVVHRVDGTADIIGASRDDQRRNLLSLEGDYLSSVTYSPEGALLFSRVGPGGDGVWVVPFDAATLEITGEPAMLVPEGSSPSLSADGKTLLYVPSTGEGLRQERGRLGLVSDLADEQGFRALTDYVPLVANREGQQISPDGTQLVLPLLDQSRSDLWIVDLERGSRQRLTDDPGFDLFPTWSDDAEWIYYTRNDMNIARIRASGGPIEDIGAGRAPVIVHGSDQLLVRRPGPSIGPGQELWFLEAAPGGEAQAFRAGRSVYGTADVAADGDLVAFASYETGDWQILVERLSTNQNWQVTATGGQYPVWGPDGDLYYIAQPRTITRIPVTSDADGLPEFGAPEAVLELTPNFGIEAIRPVMTDEGIRFLTVEREPVARGGRLVVVHGADQLIREALGR